MKRRHWQHHHDNINKQSHLVDSILRPLPNRCELLLNNLSNGKAELPSDAADDKNSDMCDADDAGDKIDDDTADVDVDDDALQIELDLV